MELAVVGLRRGPVHARIDMADDASSHVPKLARPVRLDRELRLG
jgi:hypothetical protein